MIFDLDNFELCLSHFLDFQVMAIFMNFNIRRCLVDERALSRVMSLEV
jgi:hypothetical protein